MLSSNISHEIISKDNLVGRQQTYFLLQVGNNNVLFSDGCELYPFPVSFECVFDYDIILVARHDPKKNIVCLVKGSNRERSQHKKA